MREEGLAMHVRDAVHRLQPYRPGRPLRDLERYGLTTGIKLGSNENPLGPAPEVLEAMNRALEEAWLYPEPGAPLLREALARKFGMAPDGIITGAGIDDLLDLTVRCVLDPGDNLIMAKPGFIRYAVAAGSAGGSAKEIPGTAARPYAHDLEGMLAAIDDRTRAVVVVNPNNPTGSLVSRREWESFFDRVPDHVLTILDEAYFEFVDDPQYPDGTAYLDRGKPLLVFRTFSKCHALAGLRIGYGFGPPKLIELLDRARLPFNVNTVAQAAALAAIGNEDHVIRSRELARSEVSFLSGALADRGWTVQESWANFVFGECPVAGGELAEGLLRRGFILRPLTGFGLPERFFRVSHGTREQNEAFLQALDKVTAELASP